MGSRAAHKPGALLPREIAFVKALMAGKSNKAAAIEAGYSANCASVTASRLLKMPRVNEALSTAQGTALRKSGIDAGWVLAKAVELFERTMQEVRPALHSVTRKQLRSDSGELLFTFNAAAAARALELIGKHVHVSAFQENIKLSADEDLIERLRAGRSRVAEGRTIDITPRRFALPEGGSDGR